MHMQHNTSDFLQLYCSYEAISGPARRQLCFFSWGKTVCAASSNRVCGLYKEEAAAVLLLLLEGLDTGSMSHVASIVLF